MRFAFCTALVTLLSTHAHCQDHWPQFRGPGGLGIGSGHPPTEWNVESGENVSWRCEVPGLGHSSPIVWGHRVFLTTATNSETKSPKLETGWLNGSGKSAADEGDWTWQLLCIDLANGEFQWNSDAHTGQPKSQRHTKASHANCTPATDGRFVVAFFGSEGLYCYDMDGEQKWKLDLGLLHAGPYDDPELDWGFASSPIINNGIVVVQCDCLNEHFILMVDIATGKELRRIDRGDEVATWSTPAVVETADGTQLVCNGYRRMAGYDFATGEELWHLSDGGDIPVPTPLFDGNRIYLTNGHKRNPIFAISATARGDLTLKKGEPQPEGLRWSNRTDGCYMPTPLVHDGLLYCGDDNGKLSVRESDTGKLVYRKRIGTGARVYSASPVAAGDFIYFSSERGEVTVVKAGREFEKVAANEMDNIVMATPAISGDRLLIRTVNELVCLAEE